MARLSDIAARAGVGVSTVSYVLNKTGLHKVSAPPQQLIFHKKMRVHKEQKK